MARHGSLAEQLKALLAYRNRPEGKPEPLQTNWTTVPANDNAAPAEIADFSFERKRLVTPSVAEIMRNVDTGDIERNDDGKTVRIGRIRFSDGEQTEKAYCYGPDGKVVQYDARMPVGAMLGTRDKADTQLGGKGYTQGQLAMSNDFFAETLKTIAPRYVKRTKRKNGKSYTAEESRAMLAEAYANTPVLPTVTKLKPGLPCGAPRVADSFLGMQKAKKGESGAIMWQDIATSIVNREIWEETLAALNEGDRQTLEAVAEARTLADIAPGGTDRGARKRGRRLLLAANDNLSHALKKSSA